MAVMHNHELYAKRHVMLDIETLDTRPGAAIVSIGAIFFAPDAGLSVKNPFFELVDVASCIKAGLHMDAGTIAWWMQQTDAARSQLFDQPRTELRAACKHFREWVLSSAWQEPIEPQDVVVWSNGANFDGPILKRAFESVDEAWPFVFCQELCYRTLCWLAPELCLTEPAKTAREASKQLMLSGEYGPAITEADAELLKLLDLPWHHPLRDATEQALCAVSLLKHLTRRS